MSGRYLLELKNVKGDVESGQADPSASGHFGGANMLFGDGSVRFDAGITERTAGLVYSGEGGGMNEAIHHDPSFGGGIFVAAGDLDTPYRPSGIFVDTTGPLWGADSGHAKWIELETWGSGSPGAGSGLFLADAWDDPFSTGTGDGSVRTVRDSIDGGGGRDILIGGAGADTLEAGAVGTFVAYDRGYLGGIDVATSAGDNANNRGLLLVGVDTIDLHKAQTHDGFDLV